MALARYFYLIDAKDIYIYFTSIFGSKGVMENIKLRTIRYTGEVLKKILKIIISHYLALQIKICFIIQKN